MVLTHQLPGFTGMSYEDAPPTRQDILEKPSSKEDNLRMLLDLNGGVCEVVTGVTLGMMICSVSFGRRLTHVITFSVPGSRSTWIQYQVRAALGLKKSLAVNRTFPTDPLTTGRSFILPIVQNLYSRLTWRAGRG